MGEGKLRQRLKKFSRKDISPNSSLLQVVDNASHKSSLSISTSTHARSASQLSASENSDTTLWDDAYDALKDEKPELISLYEDLLSRVLATAGADSSTVLSQPTQAEDESQVVNEIPQSDTVTRREKLNKITELGLKHMENRTVKVTILGHRIPLRDAASNVGVAVKWAQEFVKDAIKDVPYAPAVMAGISLIIPLLKNPATVEAANSEGFTYVTSQMRYYIAMEGLLLSDITAEVKNDLTERIIDLYKSIIDFQLQSIIRFYRGRTRNYFRSVFKYDDWVVMLKGIRDSETELHEKLEQVVSRASLARLDNISREAHESRQELTKIFKEIQELVKVSRSLAQNWSETENRRCRETLQATDPRLDKERIEESKGGLLKDCYNWILSHAEFKRWRGGGNGQMLWIKGDPGKGKTMLLCGIIDELSQSSPDTSVSYFFCQATHDTINNAAAVLRGLIYMLVRQQPSLLEHIRDTSFEGINAWTALSKALTNILADVDSENTCLIIDALDECVADLDSLLYFISQKSTEYPHVKWIVSSRNWPRIEKDLEDTADIKLRLELNENSVSMAVQKFTEHKVEWLAKRNKYSDETREFVCKYLLTHAKDTFLWVALVCKELNSIDRWNVQKRIGEFPPGLDELYNRMFAQVCHSDDSEICLAILRVTAMVYRPLNLEELITLVEFPKEIKGDYEAIEQIVRLCGSFLTLRDRSISLVHQSAKDFLLGRASAQLYPDGSQLMHHWIFTQSMHTIAGVLKEDLYGIEDPGFDIQNLTTPNPNPLAPARYACAHWIDHIRNCNTSQITNELNGNGLMDPFFKKNLLHWIEALVLMRAFPDGISSMVRLEKLLGAKDSTSQLAERVQDAMRFMIFHRQLIDQNPLQIYSSVLIFSPMQSITKSQFKPSKWVIESPIMDQNWSSCLLTIEHAMKYSFSLDALTWSPDEAYIAAQSDSINVKVWNSITGQCTATLRGHTENVVSVAWSEDGRLASASEDGQVRIWNAETGQCLKVLGEDEDLDGYLFSIAWSPDGSQIARTSIPPSWAVYYTMLKQIDWRQEGRVWNTDTWEATTNAKPFLSLGWSFNRLLTISPLDSDHVSIQDFVTGEEICSLEDSLDQLYSSAPFERVFWDQGQVAINHHSHVNVWDITSCKLITTLKDLPGDMSSPISTIVWSEGGIRIASPSIDRKAFSVWDESSKQETTLFGHRNLVAALSWSPDGTRLASYTDDGTIQIWDPAAGASATTADVSTLDFHAEPVESVEWSQNGKYLVSTSLAKSGFQDRYWNSIKVWDPSTNQCLFHNESMGTYSWSADGKRIAIVTLHGIEIHDLENPQDNSLDITLSESSDFAVPFHRSFFPTCMLTWSRQGDKLACTWLTGTIGFWAVEKDSSLRKMDEYIEFFDKRSPFRPTTWTISSRQIEALAWSDDGNFLAIAATDEIKIWDPNKNQWTITIGDKVPLPELVHKTLAWSKDGTRIAASSHHWVKVWSVTGDLLGKLEIPQAEPQLCSLVRKAGYLCYNSHIDSVQFDGTSRDRLRVMYDFNHTCIYQLPGVLPDINPLDHLSSQSVGYNWDQDENWITYQGKRILKVPVDYRVREDAVAGLGGRIALGCESGQVLIFNLRN